MLQVLQLLGQQLNIQVHVLVYQLLLLGKHVHLVRFSDSCLPVGPSLG